MTTETTEQPAVTITPNDLVIMRQVMEAASSAGIFKAGDLTTVGTVYDKVNSIVEAVIAESKAMQAAADEGESTEVAES